ncbi:paratose synthase [Clostridia bacterium]|nr:paratose synthase [Clostridia bacterium]
MPRVILTGATGYLGSNIAKKLIDNNYQLLCLLLRDAPISYLAPYIDRVDILYTDDLVLNKVLIEYEPDIIIHTACRYDRDGQALDSLLDANLIFPLRVLDAISNLLKPAFWINTNTALDTMLNAYSLSKHQLSEWGKFYSLQKKVHFCNILLEQFYGIGDSGSKLFPFLLAKMKNNEPINLTEGYQHRDLIYLEDVVDAYLMLCDIKPDGYRDVPLGTGEAPTIREVVEYLKAITGSTSQLNFGKIPYRDREPDISIANTEQINSLGFYCKYNWREGLLKLKEVFV